MKRTNKNAFTIVELVIVIAVIAILAAVLIPTFSNLIEKANVSNDTSLIRNLNTALAIEEASIEKNKTMGDAIEDARVNGYSIEKLTPRSNNDIVWDEVNNRFALVDQDKKVIAGDQNISTDPIKLWKIVRNSNEVKLDDYSYYLADGFRLIDKSELEFNTSIDTGNNILKLKYESSENKEISIKTNEPKIELTINDLSSNSKINHYGKVGKVLIESTGFDCYYEHGVNAFTTINKGKIVVTNSGGIEVVYATTNQIAVQTENDKAVKKAYYASDSSNPNDFSTGKGGNVNFILESLDNINDAGQKAFEDANSKVMVSGIAGFENVEFKDLNEAYNTIQPVIKDLAGLDQATATNEAFDAVFTNGGKVTWIISGKQVVDNPLVLSFGRAAAYYNPERWFSNYEIIGMNKFAEVEFVENITLPRNWWTYGNGDLTLTFKNVELSEKPGGQILVGQAYAYTMNINIDNCVVNGNIYIYHNNTLNMNITNTIFNGDNESYALTLQGEHPGTIKVDNCKFNDYSRGVNFERKFTDFILTNCTFESNRAEADRGVIQLTDGNSFKVNGNTIKVKQGNAIWFHSAAKNTDVTYEINNNDIQALYLANDDTSFGVNNKITSSGNKFNTTDVANCMEKEATQATASTVNAIK